jgi:4-amino-4-deoxy-L-arabinose transferase-like glycosyltransferase
VGTSFFLKSFFLAVRRHYQIAIVFCIGLGLRVYMANVDPILHEWDEKYHALVAKNMMSHPFKPMLYVKQYIDIDPNIWGFNHVWLHKQPLFMWQMALSMKLFGVSEFALRLPSVLMGSLMILLVYRVCILATRSKFTSVIAGILLCCSYYQLNLISGREGMDHNDIAFGFYVLCSFWAYAEYGNKASWKWVILVGVFAGCAVLNKWLTGLLVFAPWGIQTLKDLSKTKKWQSLLPFILGLLTCVAVFAPWQLYILYKFPELARYEYAYNAKHIWETVEGHKGDVWFYLNKFPLYFGENVNFLVPIGVLVICFKKVLNKGYLLTLLLPATFVFCFFSFVVQTKIIGYFFIVAPFCIIFIAVAIQFASDLFGYFKPYVGILITGFCCYWSLNFTKIKEYTEEVNYRQSKIYNTEIYKKLDSLVPPNIDLVTNVNGFEHADIMFYSRLTAYHNCFSESEFNLLAAQNIPIAAFEDRPWHTLPEYIRNYKHLFIIKEQLK